MTSRRQLLRMATTTAAGAAAAVLAANVLSPERAAANADVTIALGSLATAGIYASPNGTSRPATSLGNEFGVLGTINPGALTPSALANAAVGGFSSGGVGVSGYSSTNTGVYGNTNSGVAVLAISNSGFAVQGLSGSNSAFRGQRGGSGPLPENANYNVATVYGETNTGAAVVGTTAASGYAAIYGYSNQLTGFGVWVPVRASASTLNRKASSPPHSSDSRVTAWRASGKRLADLLFAAEQVTA